VEAKRACSLNFNRFDVVAFGDTYDFIVFDRLNGKATLYEMFEEDGEKRYDSRELGCDFYLHLKRTGI
jgi:hypothetical protein